MVLQKWACLLMLYKIGNIKLFKYISKLFICAKVNYNGTKIV